MEGDEQCNGGTALWPHTPSRTKPTLNIDHRGPVDDTTVGVGRLTASMASILSPIAKGGYNPPLN